MPSPALSPQKRGSYPQSRKRFRFTNNGSCFAPVTGGLPARQSKRGSPITNYYSRSTPSLTVEPPTLLPEGGNKPRRFCLRL